MYHSPVGYYTAYILRVYTAVEILRYTGHELEVEINSKKVK